MKGFQDFEKFNETISNINGIFKKIKYHIYLISMKKIYMLHTGFEPVSVAREATMLDQATPMELWIFLKFYMDWKIDPISNIDVNSIIKI